MLEPERTEVVGAFAALSEGKKGDYLLLDSPKSDRTFTTHSSRHQTIGDEGKRSDLLAAALRCRILLYSAKERAAVSYLLDGS